MINHPDQDMQGVKPPSGKLILPAPTDQGQHFANPSTIPIWPAQSQQAPMPQQAMDQQRVARRKDPAYMVLSLGIALVLIATIVFVAFGATTLLNKNSLASSLTPGANGTVDLKPALPTPATGPGSNQSSQPTVGPTPSLQMDQGPLTVQIVNVLNMVNNNSRVQVNVLTNKPGVQVRLRVRYSSAPFLYSGGVHKTDDNGQVTLPWSVKVYSFGNEVQATVQAIATDQNGNQVASQTMDVLIEG